MSKKMVRCTTMVHICLQHDVEYEEGDSIDLITDKAETSMLRKFQNLGEYMGGLDPAKVASKSATNLLIVTNKNR